jgi:hypothetical protein
MTARIVVEKVLNRGERRYKIVKFEGVMSIYQLPKIYVESENEESINVGQTPSVYGYLGNTIYLRIPEGETRFSVEPVSVR